VLAGQVVLETRSIGYESDRTVRRAAGLENGSGRPVSGRNQQAPEVDPGRRARSDVR